MQCLQCGADQPDANRFCTRCGGRLAGVRPSATPSEEPQQALIPSPSAKQEEEQILRELKEALKDVDPDKNPADPAPERTPWSAQKKFAVVAGAVALILVSTIAFELFRKAGGETPTPPPTPVETAIRPEPTAPPVIEDSVRTTVGKMAAILEAIDRYSKTKKGPPPALTSLNRIYTVPDTLKDGWGQNLLYLVDVTNKTFILRSVGPDGKRETDDDLSVDNEERDNWVLEHEQTISEWRIDNQKLHAQMISIGLSPEEELKRLEAARKLEEEKQRQKDEAAALAQKESVEREQRRLEANRLEEERKQAEAVRLEEEQRQVKAREEALRQQQAARRPEDLKETFINGLELWDAPPTWEIIRDKDVNALRVQGLGFLKKGGQWENYRVEFEVRVNRESAGWVLRAQNSNNFYLFKLASEKAKAIPKNSLVKYIRLEDKYLNSLKREDAPGAAGVIPLSFRVRNRDYYRIMLTVRGNTITHYIDGIQVDAWTDATFTHGRFGFNASAIEQATIRGLSIEPLR
jgi:hypothetical protein